MVWPSMEHMRCWQSKAEHGNVLIRDHLAAIHPAFQPKEEVRKAKIKRKDQIFIYILLKLCKVECEKYAAVHICTSPHIKLCM